MDLICSGLLKVKNKILLSDGRHKRQTNYTLSVSASTATNRPCLSSLLPNSRLFFCHRGRHFEDSAMPLVMLFC